MHFDNNLVKFDTFRVTGSFFVQPLLIFISDIAFFDHFRTMSKFLQIAITVIGTKHFFCVLLNLTGTFVDKNSDPSGNA